MNVSSTSTVPASRSRPGRTSTDRSRCSIAHAVWYEPISSDRCRLCAEIPSLAVANSQQAVEPHRQRRAGPVEDRPRRHRGPPGAVTALDPAITQPPAAGMTAVRAGEPARPAQPLQVVQAVLVGAEPRQELARRPRIVRPRAGKFHQVSLLRLSGYPGLRFSLGGPPLSVLARVSVSGVLADDDRRRVVAAGVQGPAIRVVSEDDAIGAQPVDQHGPVRRAGHLSGSAALRSGYPGRRGEQDGDSGQVRQDLVLADIGVLRPRGIGDGRAGVPVAAPVGGPAIGPRRFQPPSAPPARDQPGQQVPADRGPGRAARRGRVLRGDEISFADQRRVRGMFRDDPALGQVPPLHLLVPQRRCWPGRPGPPGTAAGSTPAAPYTAG